MLDQASLQASIAALRDGATANVQPLASDLAASVHDVAATEDQIARAESFTSDMKAVSAELTPVYQDVLARRSRNALLRSKLATLKAASGGKP